MTQAMTDLGKLRQALAERLIGQQHLVDRLLIGLATGGHLLLEGVPGLAKTLAVRALADAVGVEFRRVQFTPDLLPADLLGTEVFSPQTGEFSLRTGPLVTNILLADEINRAPAKVQSALLEAMQEKQITIGPHAIKLPTPFLVFATQNPIEHEGTYPLPEAQVDRFLMKVRIDYPVREEERLILRTYGKIERDAPAKSRPILGLSELNRLRQAVNAIYLDAKIEDYILDLVAATRKPADYGIKVSDLIALGASPRATLGLTLAARGAALLDGREFVTPHDVAVVGPDVLRHRLSLTYEAELAGLDADGVLKKIFDAVPVP
jgi:MoxR-like ATPase